MTTAQIDTSLVTFKAIANFCTSLEEIFGKTQRPLKLYAHLIGKTTLSHEKAISKHLSAFTLFCTSNRDALEAKDCSKLVEKKISYSERVFIDISQIFSESDKSTSNIIWTHLLTIAALVDPTGKARQILKATANKEGEVATEANFLNDIIGKVEEHVDPNANPMEAVSSIMKSGVFTDLVSGMGNGLQDGSLDLGKLMGTVQTMVTTLSGETGAESQNGENPMAMINTMLGSITAGAQNASTDEGTPEGMSGAPDLGGIMNMVGPMLGALSQTENPNAIESVEDQIEARAIKARAEGAFKSSED